MITTSRCVWARTKMNKTTRCINRATKDVVFGTEMLHLCLYHTNVVRDMAKRRAYYERLFEALKQEQESVLRAIDELRRKGLV